jgi:hypothetical protein
MNSRERFEAWCESEGISADKSRLTGIYSYPSARVAWRSWQAAERQALERALAILERFGKVSSADLIRALIEQGAQSGEEKRGD